MTREEEIERAEQNYLVNTPMSDWFSASGKSFRNGALWADEHPREGLWDAEKVIEWLKNNSSNYMTEGKNYPNYAHDALVDDLTKAMEY